MSWQQHIATPQTHARRALSQIGEVKYRWLFPAVSNKKNEFDLHVQWYPFWSNPEKTALKFLSCQPPILKTMIFNSLEFLIFFPVVTVLFFVMPHRSRWLLLLLASCYFYMYFVPVYVLILFLTIVIDFFAGILIEKAQDKQKRIYLFLSISANLGILCVFKYYNFFADNLNSVLFNHLNDSGLPLLKIILPIGLSFHTFQAMSYTIEVYRGGQKAERHFGIYALYVMFFPQLVAGPIERPQNMLYQFHERKIFDNEKAIQGLNMVMYGLFKKIVIADRLAVYVNYTYGHLSSASTLTCMLAILFFSIQLYCDFSGYSDMAIGLAKIMGFDLMTNFNRPYLATNIPDLWKRWHVSLTTWFRDYIYTPLGGKGTSKMKWYWNIYVVFLLSGIWHGANWTYIVWGLLSGLLYIIDIIIRKPLKQLKLRMGININSRLYINCCRIFIFFIISFVRIYFRAESVTQAHQMFSKIFEWKFVWNMVDITASKGPFSLLMDFAVIALLFLSYRLPQTFKFKNNLAFLVSITLLIILLGKNGHEQFIYFQF